MAHASNPRTHKTEAGVFQVQGQPGLGTKAYLKTKEQSRTFRGPGSEAGSLCCAEPSDWTVWEEAQEDYWARTKEKEEG